MGPFDLLDPPIYAVTSKSGDREDGMIATWILDVSLCAEKGRVIVALSPDHLSTELIRASQRFVLHLLAEGQHALIPTLGLSTGRDVDKLKGLDLVRTESGMPIFPGCCGYAECEVLETIDALDRTIIAAAVREQRAEKNKKPLTISAAYQALPKEIAEACDAQRRRDGLRDRAL